MASLQSILEARRSHYEARLAVTLDLLHYLRRIPYASNDPSEPQWKNDFLPGLDAATLYATVASTNPALYLEVGSGTSTKFVRRAITDHGLKTKIISIDPQPRAECDDLCDEIIRTPFEDVDLSIVDVLGSGDVFFLDGSHRVFPNSDATVAFLEVLPRLQRGVLVQVHDIWLPDDYDEEFAGRLYSEQYLLAAWLLADGPHIEVDLPNWFIATDPRLQGMLNELWETPGMEDVKRHGHSFWLRRT